MKKKTHIFLWMLLVFCLCLSLPVMAAEQAEDEEEVTQETEAAQLYNIELSQDVIEFSRPGKTKTLKVTYDEEEAGGSGVTWSSDDKSVAKVSSKGKVTAVGRGSCTISATSVDDPTITAECEVYVEKYSVTYHYKNGEETQTKYYTGEDEVTLKSLKRSKYIFDGWYTSSDYSKRIRRISADNTKNYSLYAKWTKVSKPGKPSVTVSSTSAKKLKVSLKKKVSGADGYQIVVAKNKSMTSGKKTVTTTATAKTLSGLTAGAKYFVKVRAYTSDSTGAKIYGSYSAVKSVTVKKAAVKKSSSSSSSSSSGSDGGTVYITSTGSKYHKSGCHYLSKSKTAISKSKAISQGYTACKVCKP